MGYRNKTYVAFASEDLLLYRLMEAWRENQNIDFDFYDAHDLFVSRDSSSRDTIKRNLRERLKNAKQVVLIGSDDAKRKGGDGYSFLAHEIEIIQEFKLPIVIANKGGGRVINRDFIPQPLLNANYNTVSVSLQPAIIKFALNNYAENYTHGARQGPEQYSPAVYTALGL